MNKADFASMDLTYCAIEMELLIKSQKVLKMSQAQEESWLQEHMMSTNKATASQGSLLLELRHVYPAFSYSKNQLYVCYSIALQLCL